MPLKPQKPPRSISSLKIKRAVAKLKAMSMSDRVQLMVKARLMTQEEADQAKLRLAKNGDGD